MRRRPKQSRHSCETKFVTPPLTRTTGGPKPSNDAGFQGLRSPPRAMEVDVRPLALVKVAAHGGGVRRVHQAQRAPLGRGQPVEHGAAPTHRVLDRFERCAAVQAVVRRGVVLGQRGLKQVFELVERDVQAQIALGVGQRPADVSGIGTGVARQSAGQAAGHGAEEAFDVGPVIGRVRGAGVDKAADEVGQGVLHIAGEVGLGVVKLEPLPGGVAQL